MKFRIWNVENQRMLSWEAILDRTVGSLFTDHNIFMYYTGMHDISGTEVYEGDIVEDAGGRKLQIKYGTYWAYCPVSKCKIDNVGFYAEADGLPKMPLGPLSEYARIIGNIYEH